MESEIAIASVNVDEVEVDSEDQLTLNQLKLGGIQVKEGEGDLTIEDVSIDQVRNQQANNFSMKQLNLQNFENIEKLSIESAEARNIPLVTLLERRSTYCSDCSVERLKDYRFAICLFSLKMRKLSKYGRLISSNWTLVQPKMDIAMFET